MTWKIIRYLLLIISINLAGCSAQQIYQATAESDRSDASLYKETITLDFGKITYLDNDVTSTEAILLLHGYSGDKDLWNYFASYLNPSWKIIIPDLPGHGESVARNDLGYSISHQAEMLYQFIRAKKLTGVHLVGSSMGGAISLKFTATYPELVKSLTLVDALGVMKTKSVVQREIEETGNNPLYGTCDRKSFDHFVYLSMEQVPFIPGMIFDYMMKEKCKRSVLEKMIFTQMAADMDLLHAVKTISKPTLILWGKKDRILHPDNASLYKEHIKDSKLVTFDEVGHLPYLEVPGKAACEVEKFISQYYKRTGP